MILGAVGILATHTPTQQASPLRPCSKVDLGAELEQPPGQYLRRSQILRTVRRGREEDGAPVEYVVDIEQALHVHASHSEALAQADVKLGEPVFERRKRRVQLGKDDRAGTDRGCAA